MQPFVIFGRTKAISFIAEGFGVCAYASGQPSATFGPQKVISFGSKVMVFELVLLSVHLIPSDMLGSIRCSSANRLGSISEGEGFTGR